MLEILNETVSWLKPQIPKETKIGIILGSGLGALAEHITDKKEISYENIDKIRGMNVVFVTTASSDEEAYELLRLFGMPFKRAQ